MSRNITDLHPKLQVKANNLVARAASKGYKVSITSCVRNMAEQEDCVRRKTSKVHYPHSHHNWGTAFDICRNDGKKAYDNSDGFFDKIGKIGEELGLIWGGSWDRVDKPHFQLKDWGVTTAQLQARYDSPAAFKETWKTSDIKLPIKSPKTIYASAIVNTKLAPLLCHTSANKKSAVLCKFKKGTVVELIQYVGSWYKVRGKDTKGKIYTGWCASKYLK